jgi:hypothetical protein
VYQDLSRDMSHTINILQLTAKIPVHPAAAPRPKFAINCSAWSAGLPGRVPRDQPILQSIANLPSPPVAPPEGGNQERAVDQGVARRQFPTLRAYSIAKAPVMGLILVRPGQKVFPFLSADSSTRFSFRFSERHPGGGPALWTQAGVSRLRFRILGLLRLKSPQAVLSDSLQ